MNVKEYPFPDCGRRILGVDPGLAACGFALIDRGSLVLGTIRTRGIDLAARVREIAGQIETLTRYHVDLLVIEHMKVYTDGPGDPQDLINLAVVEGAVLGALSWNQCLLPSPGQWSGGVPKEIRHRRLRRDYAIVGSSQHALDALGIALWGHRNAKA